MKNLRKKAADPHDALLACRTTPLECGYSPGTQHGQAAAYVSSYVGVEPTTPVGRTEG